jgi:predicted glycosyltransferase
VIERARPDFRTLLGRCALSVSQGGYNTVVEVLAAGCPAVVVPYAEDGETEQTERCRLLAERGLLQPLAARELDPPGLARLVAQVLASPARPGPSPRMDGAAVTARLLRRLTCPTGA